MFTRCVMPSVVPWIRRTVSHVSYSSVHVAAEAYQAPPKEEYQSTTTFRTPLYLQLQNLQDPVSGSIAERAERYCLQGKRRSFLTTDAALVQQIAKDLLERRSAVSNFPKDPSTIFCANLKGEATLRKVYESLAAHVGMEPDPVAQDTSESLVKLLKQASANQHLYILLDCSEFPEGDAGTILDTIFSLEAAAKLPRVTLGAAVASQLLQCTLKEAVQDHCVAVRPGVEVTEGSTLEIDHPSLGDRGGLMVKRGDRLYGFMNWCPHVGTPLNMFPDHFWDFGKKHILCSTHGAVFHPEDGMCLGGPCAGKALRSVPLLQSGDGQVVLPSKKLRSILLAFDYV